MEIQNSKTKKKPTKIEDMTKEQVRQAILKKQECNTKAQSIVESLLEKGISETHFIECLPDINQSHFEDVIEERNITHLCGYPLCSKSISEKDIPKQKYRISMKTNKVYDITARKKFCSNECYKFAMYIKKQMLTSPLWFREYEEIPKFQLLTLASVGSLGQEVDLSIIEKLDVKPVRTFTSINDFTSASLDEMSCDSHQDKKDKNEKCNVESDQDNNSTAINKNNQSTSSCVPRSIDSSKEKDENVINSQNKSITGETPLEASLKDSTPKTKISQKKITSNPMNIVGDIVEKPERKIDPIVTNIPDSIPNKETRRCKKMISKKQHSITVITIEVEKCLAEWFSLDTLLFLFGKEKVKEMVTDKGECIKEYLNNYANGLFYSANSYDHYQELCRKLNILELEDRRYDTQTLQREMKPLPDYSIVQEESKKMQLKVRAFLAGETDVPEVDNNVKQMQNSTEQGAVLTQLPLVDKNAQNALRRRIVCQHLNKILPDLLQSLGLLTLSIGSEVHLLVKTFKLKANNIMFKPIQWTLIAIVVIKLLSIRDKRLEYLLEQQIAYKHMQLLLLSYKQDGGYLDRLVSWLTEIDRLLDVNDTQLTIE